MHTAWLDRNGDGWISAAELSEALGEYGISVDAPTLAPLIAADFHGQQGEEPHICAADFKARAAGPLLGPAGRGSVSKGWPWDGSWGRWTTT